MRHPIHSCLGPASSISRRSLLAGGLGAFLGGQILQWQHASAAERARRMPASGPMSCILVWLNGGPSHLDTFDPKPGSKTGGSFKAIKTRVNGLTFCEHLPQLAEQADKLSVVRSMTSKEGNHDRGRYLMHTGYVPSGTIQHPSLGSWVSHELGDRGSETPQFVCIRGGTVGSGFLGVEHAPLSVQDPHEGLRNLHPAKNVDDARFAHRERALALLQAGFASRTHRPEIGDLSSVYAKARRLMTSSSAAAFDISRESAATQQAYGSSPFGQGCLMARRLIETDVKFVEVTLDGWDTHVDNFSQVQSLCGELDPALSTLLRELEERRLLARTLVVCMGEFGRSPAITAQEGRDHYPQAWSMLMAGGRVRRGYVHGATDAEGAKVASAAVTVPDLFATLAKALEIDPKAELMSPIGRPIAISDSGKAVDALLS